MTANKHIKFAIHPGTMIRDELKARGISNTDFANAIGKTTAFTSWLLSGKKYSITPDVAIRIGNVLNINPVVLLALQAEYSLWKKYQSNKEYYDNNFQAL